ncbi:unnamed protein product [Blepharisma stoltei]|uniref:Uncharacterized protein n=1 Tax=Blepharisma stoltei TaxID=1481888 RepID=A0AAU9IPH5_9CILI|nr:unnamed protein product [Blepharisma stoltei]
MKNLQTDLGLKDLNIFASMFSLLSPSLSSQQLPASLNLPALSIFGESPTPEPDGHIHPFESFVKVMDESRRKAKSITACPHTERKHYAKNMCNNCYHRLGRDKQAWACPHEDRQHYAKGKCQMCYLQHYHKSRNTVRRKGKKITKFNEVKSNS